MIASRNGSLQHKPSRQVFMEEKRMNYTNRLVRCRKTKVEAEITRTSEGFVFLFCPRCGMGNNIGLGDLDLSNLLREVLNAKASSLPVQWNYLYRPRFTRTEDSTIPDADEHFEVY